RSRGCARAASGAPRVPDDLPEVSVRIAEVPRVDPPGTLVRLVGQRRAGSFGLGEQPVDLLAADEVPDAELTRAGGAEPGVGVLLQVLAAVDGEREPALQLEHRGRAAGARVGTDELGPDHPRRSEPERAVEGERTLEVVDPEGDHVAARAQDTSVWQAPPMPAQPALLAFAGIESRTPIEIAMAREAGLI